MEIKPIDLVRALEGRGGAAFEEFLYDLLVLETRKEGISPTCIVWDHRTTVPDGGRDICITEGAASPTSLIPPEPSIWSAKAGQDGLKERTLEKEVTQHKAIKTHLSDGKAYRYVILMDCSQEQRATLITKARELCNDLEIPESRILVVFNDQLAQCASRCSSVIPQHLPDLRQRLGTGATAADTWIGDVRQGATPYMEIAARDAVVAKLRQLLNGESDLRYLHIAGWSGIGKSRLVAEELAQSKKSSLVVIYRTWTDFETGLLPAVRSGQVEAATVIVDEVDMANVATLMDLCACRPGFRLISLGASELSQRLPRSCEFLDRPSENALADIIRARAANTFEDAVVRRITDLADGDVRFAELLTDAAQHFEAGEGAPSALIEALHDLATIVSRYFTQHRDSVGDAVEFRRLLSVITLLAEVGARGGKEGELEVLADHCGKSVPDILYAIGNGESIGVCQWVGDLVECIPRPLAAYIFERDAWPLISHDLLSFFTSLPSERARRSFLRRVAYCSAQKREEVEKSLGDMFWDRYADADLTTLADPDFAHTLRVLIEVVPHQGLVWLRRLIDGATLEQLFQFPGSTSTFGPTYGRREIVWLCEHLKCFGDCFVEAEAILFRLALAETEQLGNNATAEWQQCFWWRLSGTEVPLSERIDILVDRLRRADETSFDLLLKGAIAALHEPMAAIVPPEFVGGRTTPSEWQPKVYGDIFSQWDRVIMEVIALSQIPAFRRLVVVAVINNLELFVQRGLPDDLRDQALKPAELDDAQIRALRLSLDRLLNRYSSLADEVKAEVAEWRDTLVPQALPDRIRDVVGRDTWDHERDEEDTVAWCRPYEALAQEIAATPEVLLELQDWLSSDAARSPRALAAMIGHDAIARGAVKDTMLRWLNEGACTEFVIGYFVSVSGDDRVLPEWASEALSAAAKLQPDMVVTVTVESDNSQKGLRRIFDLMPSCAAMPSALLSRLFGNHWEAVLTPNDKRRTLDILLGAGHDPYAHSCGLQLLTMWYHRNEDGIDKELDEAVGHLVTAVLEGSRPRRSFEWEGAMKWWAQRHPEDASELLVDAMTSTDTKRMGLADEAEKILLTLAPHSPDCVAAAVERALSEEEPNIAFHISVYRELFEHLGMERVKAMIDRLGEDGAAVIARHLPDPGTTIGVDLLEWFLKTYAHNDHVFSSYICGRHSGKAVWGYGFQRRDEIYQRTESFINSANPGVRKWAEWERAEIDREAERDRKRVDEMGRG